MNRDDLIRKLKSLLSLSENGGTEAEGIAAAEKLSSLMQKYDISDEELSDATVNTYKFKHHGNRGEKILLQIAFKVIPGWTSEVYIYRKNGRKISGLIGFECTYSQKVQIEFLYDFYFDLYEREEEAFFQAYIQKHRLFGDHTIGNEKIIDSAEYEKMKHMMDSMDDDSPLLRLEHK